MYDALRVLQLTLLNLHFNKTAFAKLELAFTSAHFSNETVWVAFLASRFGDLVF